VVRPVVTVTDGRAAPTPADLEALAHRIASLGVDAEPEVRFDRNSTDALLLARRPIAARSSPCRR
jgi:hypothetical protein